MKNNTKIGYFLKQRGISEPRNFKSSPLTFRDSVFVFFFGNKMKKNLKDLWPQSCYQLATAKGSYKLHPTNVSANPASNEDEDWTHIRCSA